jgi:hypothetical protein
LEYLLKTFFGLLEKILIFYYKKESAYTIAANAKKICIIAEDT